MVHHNGCPLCNSEEINLLFSCTDHFVSREVFHIFSCASCGFRFTQDYPEENDIGRYYESADYISHSDTSKGFSNKVYRLARKIMLQRKRVIIERTTGLQNGSLLDIGSGTGHFAATMKKGGWTVRGIEINEKARNFSVSNFGLDAIAPDQISEINDSSFDCITLWHVLEHFHDPLKYLSEISRILKQNGICLIALPNSGSYDAEHYGSYWAAYDLPRHLWHFSPETFRMFADKGGFTLKKVMNLPLDVFYISILSKKYGGSKLAFARGIIRALPWAFLSVFNKERSSSVIYILHK